MDPSRILAVTIATFIGFSPFATDGIAVVQTALVTQFGTYWCLDEHNRPQPDPPVRARDGGGKLHPRRTRRRASEIVPQPPGRPAPTPARRSPDPTDHPAAPGDRGWTGALRARLPPARRQSPC